MPTLTDWLASMRDAVTARDLDRVAGLAAQLRESNPEAAAQFGEAVARAYWELADGADPDEQVEWAGLGCGAWRKAPRVIGGPSHTHVCRRAPEHEGPHACHSGDGFTWG